MIKDNPKDKILYFKVADLIFCLIFDNKKYYEYFKIRYKTIKNVKKCQKVLTIKINNAKENKLNGFYFIDKKPHKQGIFLYSETGCFDKNLINFYLKAFIELFAIQYDILFLHGSSCSIDDKCYIFCGKAGSGKSTIIKNIKKTNVLGDDTSILKFIRNKIYVYTSPFDNLKYPGLSYQKKLLNGIYIIKQAHFNKIDDLEIKDSIKSLFLNCKIYSYFLEKYKVFKKENITKAKLHSRRELVKPERYLKKVYKLILDLIVYNIPKTLNFKKQINILKFINNDYATKI